jgi:prevent-host-death family protein
MKDVDVFSARDLRNNTGQLIKDAEKGQLSLITKHGAPRILAVPFDSQLLNLGVNKSLALHLFEKKIVTLSQAAKIAKLSIDEFLEILKETDIDVVDYPESEVDTDLENIPGKK